MIRSKNLGWATAKLRLVDHLYNSFSTDEVHANISGRLSGPNYIGAELVILWETMYIFEHDGTLHSFPALQPGKTYLGDSQIQSLVLTHNHPGWMLENFPYPPSRITCRPGNQTSLRFQTETGEDITFIPDFDHQLKLILPDIIRCLSDEAEINEAVNEAVMKQFPDAEQLMMKYTGNRLTIVQCLLTMHDTDDETDNWDSGSLPGFLVECQSKYFFFEQGHIDGSLTLDPLSKSLASTDLTSCRVTLPASYATTESMLGSWIKSMPNIEVQYSPKTVTPFFSLSSKDEEWTINSRYGIEDKKFELTVGSFLYTCNHDIEWNTGLV